MFQLNLKMVEATGTISAIKYEEGHLTELKGLLLQAQTDSKKLLELE